MLYTVRYVIGSYNGEVLVNETNDADDETIIAKARNRIKCDSPTHLPMVSERWEVIRK